MEQTLFRKELVFGVVFLLVAICIIPSISGDIEDNSSHIKIEKNGEPVTIFEDPPGIEWFQSYGGSESDYAWSVKQTNDGGYVFTGETQSYGEYGTTDAWLCKTDASGNVVWNYAFGEPGGDKTDYGREVILTSDGGYAFTGLTRSYNVEVEIEIWLVKTDEDGNEEWNRRYGRGRGFAVHQTLDDGYIIGGNTEINGAFLLRTDSNGNEVWRRDFWGGTSGHANGRSVDATTDGGFVITGILHYPDDLNKYDLFLIKTDADGVELINTTIGGSSIYTSGRSVQQTTEGGFVICGYYADNNEIEGCAWLIKTDAYGNEKWNQTYNETLNYRSYIANECKQTSDGGYVLVGRKQPNSGLMDSFLIKTDSIGEKEWELTLEGPETSDEYMFSVDLTQDGGFIAVGKDRGNALLIKIGHIVDISINKPENALYLFDSKIRNYLYRNALIIGPITVEVDASDDEYDIDRVEFYVDGQLMETDTAEPYSWSWNKLAFFRQDLKVVAFNSNGNVGIEEKSVLKFF